MSIYNVLYFILDILYLEFYLILLLLLLENNLFKNIKFVNSNYNLCIENIFKIILGGY